MINNLGLIKPLLNFENEGDFYMLYIFKRKKDQPLETQNEHQSVRTIKSYCVESVEYLDKRWDEIVQLCEMFKARAYIHVQKQNHTDVGLEMISTISQKLKNGQINQKYVFDSVVGKIKTYEKRWVVDIDTKDTKEVLNIQQWVDHCRPHGEDKIIITTPTKSGYHLITKRFDVMEFKKKYPEVDIQKKNPTLLFLPDSISNIEEGREYKIGDTIKVDNGQRIVSALITNIHEEVVFLEYDTTKTICLTKKDLDQLVE